MSRLVHDPYLWTVFIIVIVLALLYYSVVFLGFRPVWLKHLKIFEYQTHFHGVLLCVPLIYSAVIFKWRGLLAVWLISVLVAMPLAFYYNPFRFTFLWTLFYLSIISLVAVSIILWIEWREREQRALVQREEERQVYMAQIFQAQEEERKRIAQELHDDIIHSLLITASKIKNIPIKANGKTTKQLKEEANAVGDEILRVSNDLRRLTVDLRPGILDNVGFIPAVRWLVDHLNQEGTNTKILIKGNQRQVSKGIDVILFRIIQEALNNIRLHSEATEATVTLEFANESMILEVYDNGKGFALPPRINLLPLNGKLGLMGIQERVHSVKGSLSIRSSPVCGTLISVSIKA